MPDYLMTVGALLRPDLPTAQALLGLCERISKD